MVHLELTNHINAIKEFCDVDPIQMESVISVKHGIDVTSQLQQALTSVPHILSASDRKA
jgi:hypothetical protein